MCLGTAADLGIQADPQEWERSRVVIYIGILCQRSGVHGHVLLNELCAIIIVCIQHLKLIGERIEFQRVVQVQSVQILVILQASLAIIKVTCDGQSAQLAGHAVRYFSALFYSQSRQVHQIQTEHRGEDGFANTSYT